MILPRIAVTGGRDYGHTVPECTRVWRVLDRVWRKHPEMVLVHGDCFAGADATASAWAQDRGVAEERHPAAWSTHGKRAGPMRNREMARSGLTGCIAFPGGRGTANMVAECRAAGVIVWEIGP